ncbi:hypothetical protein EYS42_16610 [Aquabacterium lacunae]|uniref:HEPN AbiU2-like domain-containing protein n=1 Tax=Aquabacterium lacunae TaxID=2528630 RepID=A0A4Q9GVC0_9BURK|nr:hypothetical protein [Aquabacterium lacunae]TBO27607.1 hypothetical protein EYS42_16610 [Aquabacterium lacunae]
MNQQDLEPHKSAMEADGYQLDDSRFARLKQWHGVLFQLASAKHYLDQIKAYESDLGDLQNAYELMAQFSAFVLQYSKCFTSGGKGQTTLDENKVFASNADALNAHKRILDIRHNLVAHNGNSELILANLGVKEQEDRFVVKHYLTLAIPLGELDAFESALETATQHSILAVNKHLDSIGEQLGKIVLLDEA